MTMNDEQLYVSTDNLGEPVDFSCNSTVGFLLKMHNIINMGLDIGAFDAEDFDALSSFHEALIETVSQYAVSEIDDTES